MHYLLHKHSFLQLSPSVQPGHQQLKRSHHGRLVRKCFSIQRLSASGVVLSLICPISGLGRPPPIRSARGAFSNRRQLSTSNMEEASIFAVTDLYIPAPFN